MMQESAKRVAVLGAMAAASLLAGCRQDMHNQPKFYPQRGSSFFVDGRSVRPQVENTVGRNQLRQDVYFNTGMVGGREGDSMPFPVTPAVMARGQERYNVYCTPCHSRVGNGAGMIVQRGYSPAGNLQGTRLRGVGLGHFFSVITNGYGSMPEYSAQVSVEDRWAIAAYIRALQLSQSAQRADVPSGAEVKPLASIAAAEGLPESFAGEWEGPSPAEMPGATNPGLQSAPSTKPVAAEPAPAAPAGAGSLSNPAGKSTANTTAIPLPPGASANGGPKANGPKPGAKADAITPVKKEVNLADAKAGQAIYLKNCQVCHTAQLTGHPPTFPSLVGVVQRLGAAHVRSNVQHGAPPMPAFPQISSSELDQLVAYLSNPAKAGATVAANK